jgi:DNA topoisomerase-1
VQVKQEMEAELRDGLPALKPEEAAVMAFLRQRLARAVG